VSFDSDESSRQDSQPVEGFKFVLPTVTYRLTSAAHDVTINAEVYTAATITRGNVVVTGDSDKAELVVTMPVSHPIAQRYLQQGVPPRDVLVTCYRQQPGGFEQWWKGYATSIGVSGREASFRIPSLIADVLRRKLPVIGASRSCPHILYDPNTCKLSRAASGIPTIGTVKISTTIAAPPSGSTLVVAALGTWPNHAAQLGEVVHVASGERRSIFDQVGTTLSLQMPILEAANGDAVDVYVGCSHFMETPTTVETFPAGCRGLQNVDNYGGFPAMSMTDVFDPGGVGVLGIR
jgi:hypothetical protein